MTPIAVIGMAVVGWLCLRHFVYRVGQNSNGYPDERFTSN